jgi:hypothetical protein
MPDIVPNETVLKVISEFRDEGFCILRGHLPCRVVNACRDAFWPSLLAYLQCGHAPNRGPNRHFLPMPFERPCFAPELFFDPDILRVVRGLMDERIVVDQWGCDVPVRGSEYQAPHVDYKRPLFPELPDFELPPYAIVVSFGLVPIAREHGPIEIAPGTHRMRRTEAIDAVDAGQIVMRAVTLALGDVLIRHPWALHRGTPNTTDVPRALCTIRYVRRWYADDSRDVNRIPRSTWDLLTSEQQSLMRFPIRD